MVTDYYSKRVLTTLLLMVLSGAGRTIAIKLFFQAGFDDPFFTAFLMLFAHSLALPLYWSLSRFETNNDEPHVEQHQQQQQPVSEGQLDCDPSISDEEKHSSFYHSVAVPLYNEIFYPEGPPPEVLEQQKKARDDAPTVFGFWHQAHSTLHQRPVALEALTLLRTATFQTACSETKQTQTPQANLSSSRHSTASRKGATLKGAKREELPYYDNGDDSTAASTEDDKGQASISPKGSLAGLSDESREAIQWVHKIPEYAKPLASACFNMLDVGFRMLALATLPASIMEATAGGLELLLSVLSARCIRKREIYMTRWAGAGIVVVGLVFVAVSENTNSRDTESSLSSSSLGLGLLFVLLKTISSCLKDMAQELFTQESNYPATLLLGYEGLYGLILAMSVSFTLGPVFGYSPNFGETIESARSVSATVGLVLVLFTAGIFSILGTALTSAMTRNMWKNFRGLVVWIVGVVIYYASANENLGEPFVVPGSFLLLLGFAILLIGLYVYYKR